MVQTIGGAGGVLLRHIEGLLTVSRDEIGAEAPPPERVDLYALLVSLRAMLAVEADRKGVRLGLSIDAAAPRFIRAEPGLLLDTIQKSRRQCGEIHRPGRGGDSRRGGRSRRRRPPASR